MIISIKPTAQTRALIRQFGNSSSIIKKAKKNGLIKASNIFRSKAIKEAPVAKGTLRKSILADVENDGNSAKVFSKLDYAKYQEEGTGIYGKRRSPITSKRGKLMRFKGKSGKIIFARKIKGVKARWFMKKGAKHLQGQTNIISRIIFETIEKGLNA